MKQKTRSKRSIDHLQKLLLKYGHSEQEVKTASENIPETAHDRSMQAEATLYQLAKPSAFMTKVCKQCGEEFSTSYRSVAYCSDTCRAKHLQSQSGIVWNPNKPAAERWGGEPPLIVPPEAYKKLKEFADHIQSQIQIETPQVAHVEEDPFDEVFQPQVEESTEESHPQSDDDSQTSHRPSLAAPDDSLFAAESETDFFALSQ